MRDLSYYFFPIIVPIQTISEKLLTYITKVFTVLAKHFIPTLLFHKLISSLLSFENIYEKYSNQDHSYWLIGINTSNLIKANHTVILKNWCYKCFKSILFRRYSRSWKDSEGSRYNRDQYDDNDWRGYESNYPQSNDYEQDKSRRYHLYDDYYQDDGRDLGGEGDNQHWQDDYQNHRGDEGYRSYHDQSQYSNSCPQKNTEIGLLLVDQRVRKVGLQSIDQTQRNPGRMLSRMAPDQNWSRRNLSLH